MNGNEFQWHVIFDKGGEYTLLSDFNVSPNYETRFSFTDGKFTSNGADCHFGKEMDATSTNVKEFDFTGSSEIKVADLKGVFFVKTFEVDDVYELMLGYRYKGLATIDEEIYVTAYTSPGIYVTPVGGDVEEPEFFKTSILTFMHDDGFYMAGEVIVDDMQMGDMIDGMFMGAFGAASTFDKYMTITPATEQLYVGYGTSPAQGIASFVEEFFPTDAFGEVTWDIDFGGNYVIDNEDGTFTAIEANIGSSASARIYAEAEELSTGMMRQVFGDINITRLYPPPEPPTPEPPKPKRGTLPKGF